MKLINKTKWDTVQLRKLCLIVINNLQSPKDHTITVKTSGINQKTLDPDVKYGGMAVLNGTAIDIKVPLTSMVQKIIPINPVSPVKLDEGFVSFDNKIPKTETKFKRCEREPVKFNSVIFASVLSHEIIHNHNLDHNIMAQLSDYDCSYAKNFFVEAQNKKYEKALKKVKEHTIKLKRANTLVTKWKSRADKYKNVRVTGAKTV